MSSHWHSTYHCNIWCYFWHLSTYYFGTCVDEAFVFVSMSFSRVSWSFVSWDRVERMGKWKSFSSRMLMVCWQCSRDCHCMSAARPDSGTLSWNTEVLFRVGHGISHKSLRSHKSHKSRDGISLSEIGTCGICGTFAHKILKSRLFQKLKWPKVGPNK